MEEPGDILGATKEFQLVSLKGDNLDCTEASRPCMHALLMQCLG